MGKYSIKELEHLSGIKAHTIRIWEKRHKVIEPSRTSTNIRFYSDADLKKIINISLLNNQGVKISKIITLSNEELSKKVSELNAGKNDAQVNIDRLVLAMIDLKEEHFEKTLASIILNLGFERTIIEVMYPFLEKVGVLWHTGIINPAQEHFISQLIRQKILVRIDGLPYAAADAACVVLFLPENELHEIGLLFYNYLLRKSGKRTIYLGQTVPYADLKFVCDTHQPSFIVTSITTYLSVNHVQRYIDKIATDFPAATILIAGAAIKRLKLTFKPNIGIMEGVSGLKKLFSLV